MNIYTDDHGLCFLYSCYVHLAKKAIVFRNLCHHLLGFRKEIRLHILLLLPGNATRRQAE
jgi:hypothetical protein